MSRELWLDVLPYTYVVGQADIKRALELNYVAPRIGGVLIAGDRGTAKSTIVRLFALMVYGQLPVTLPINATDDRTLGGWRLDELMEGRVIEQKGLLELAGERGVLYIDEVNLLDDHVVTDCWPRAAAVVASCFSPAGTARAHMKMRSRGSLGFGSYGVIVGVPATMFRVCGASVTARRSSGCIDSLIVPGGTDSTVAFFSVARRERRCT